jgi:predicted lipoprotein
MLASVARPRIAQLVALLVLVLAGCRTAPPMEPLGERANAGSGGSAAQGGTGGGQDGRDAGGGEGGTGGGSGASGNSGEGGAGGVTPDGGDGSTPDAGEAPWPTPTFSKRRLLDATATCVVLNAENFLDAASALRSATAALAADPGPDTLDTARKAWREAMQVWQRNETLQVGPASADTMTGGQSLRDQIYAFPSLNRCAIDANLVDEAYANDPFSKLLVNQRGLGALEYLLFHDGSSNACPAASRINDDGSWAALSASELEARRAAYAAEAGQEVLARAEALVEAWAVDGGNFRETLVDTGSSNPFFGSQQVAFNAINEALYYVELDVKDKKLGAPLAVSVPCIGPCTDLVESRFARVSTDNLRENLIGTRKLFAGCGPQYSGLGFDDWLVNVGRPDLAESMSDALQGAQEAIDALDPLLEDAIASNPAKARAVYDAIKVFTDLLKSDFITTLNLEPPAASIGDND